MNTETMTTSMTISPKLILNVFLTGIFVYFLAQCSVQFLLTTIIIILIFIVIRDYLPLCKQRSSDNSVDDNIATSSGDDSIPDDNEDSD